MNQMPLANLYAVTRNELLLNSRRVVPYAMAALCAGNALLWWGWGPASSGGWAAGWAVNSERFIAGVLPVFSFMTLPLFTAVFMGDPVVRDFRLNVSPLVFSKPIRSADYLLGKFCGNFFTLVCCQAAFPATLFVLQWFRRPGMIVETPRVFPYFKHFLLLVVLSHLLLGAFHFAVGTLTRNARVVYAAAVALYPLYAAYHAVFLNSLPVQWRVWLDPLLMDWLREQNRGQTADRINRAAVNYGAGVVVNRACVVALAAGCLALLYARFSTTERAAKDRGGDRLTTIDLRADEEWLYGSASDYAAADFDSARPARETVAAARTKAVALPKVGVLAGGVRAGFAQFLAAARVEFRLLLAERSLVVLLPVAALASLLGLAYFPPAPDQTYSAAYAARTADTLLLFLVAVAVFYTGEALHRDRELRVEPVVWATPAPNSVLLLSKFAGALLLSLATMALVGVAALALQIYKGHAPAEPAAYLRTYGLVLVPGAAFMCATVVALNVLLRDKYLAYAACLGLGLASLYLFNLGYNRPLYNPLLYGLWMPADLAPGAPRLPLIITHAIYCLALAALSLALAHLFFARRTTAKTARAGARLRGKLWALVAASVAAVAAVAAGSVVFNVGR